MSEQPRSRSEMRAADRRKSRMGILVGLLVVVLIGGGAWLAKGLVSGPDAPAGAPTTAPPQTAPTTPATPTTSSAPPTTADPLAAAVAECRQSWKLQTAATDAAATALGQWWTHLMIMNDLQAYKITVPEAKKLWGPTTKDAEQHNAAFDTADAAFTSAKSGCRVPDGAAAGPKTDALRACASASAKQDAVLKNARTAIAVWETHLKDQSHFKAGGMTAIAAEAKWRVLWQKGLATMPAYRNAVAAAKGASCTLPAA